MTSEKMSEELRRARAYEETYVRCVPETERPVFHATAGIGWMNDPNGFSAYQGEYHLFYQYNPYSTHWDRMHWGHMKTKDFIRWEHLGAALAPDHDFDRDGCWSGSAVELPDGRQLLMYTGIRNELEQDGVERMYQTQCLAVGDGRDYEKYPGNPVLTMADLPEGSSPHDFRDPKLWRDPEGRCFAAAVTRAEDGSGAVVLYESEDGFAWRFSGVIDRCRNEYGKMWECPDFFPLDGKQVLLVSPMEMQPVGLQFHAGYGAVCKIGTYEKGVFSPETVHSMDYGLDFYAAQTMETPDGRRILIAWMQNWATTSCQSPGIRCFGEMTVPRELSIREGCLIQTPVRELEGYRTNPVRYQNLVVTEELHLEGIRGRVLDLTVCVRPAWERGYREFQISLAKDGEHETAVRYRPKDSVVQIDRSRCGAPYDIVHTRSFYVRQQNGSIKLRLLMDRHSLELFVNDGEQTASLLLYAPEGADRVTFQAHGGAALMDVAKYDIALS